MVATPRAWPAGGGAAVVALLVEGWTVDEVAVVHRLSVHDLAVLDASRDRPGRDLHP